MCFILESMTKKKAKHLYVCIIINYLYNLYYEHTAADFSCDLLTFMGLLIWLFYAFDKLNEWPFVIWCFSFHVEFPYNATSRFDPVPCHLLDL